MGCSNNHVHSLAGFDQTFLRLRMDKSLHNSCHRSNTLHYNSCNTSSDTSANRDWNINNTLVLRLILRISTYFFSHNKLRLADASRVATFAKRHISNRSLDSDFSLRNTLINVFWLLEKSNKNLSTFATAILLQIGVKKGILSFWEKSNQKAAFFWVPQKKLNLNRIG